MKKIGILGIFSSSLLLVFAACNNPRNTNTQDSVDMVKDINDTTAQVNQADAEFAVKAANAGLAEVQLAEVALTLATHDQIKSAVQSLSDDHHKAHQELSEIAAEKQITLPPVPGTQEVEAIKTIREIPTNEFDRRYLNRLINNHENTVSLFEDASNNAKDVDLQAFAAKHLPAFKRHDQHLKNLRDSLGFREEIPVTTPVVP